MGYAWIQKIPLGSFENYTFNCIYPCTLTNISPSISSGLMYGSCKMCEVMKRVLTLCWPTLRSCSPGYSSPPLHQAVRRTRRPKGPIMKEPPTGRWKLRIFLWWSKPLSPLVLHLILCMECGALMSPQCHHVQYNYFIDWPVARTYFLVLH